MDRERYETGLRIRKEVLGEDYVARKLDEADDFDAEFQNVVTEAWGATWGRGVLTKRERSMMNLGMLAAMGRMHEFELHFGGAILKLLLSLKKVPPKKVPKSQRHRLTMLYDAIPHPYQKQLESTYRASRRVSGNYELFMFKNTTSATEAPLPPPPTRNINSLRGFFEYLGKDVIMWQKRYSWEHVEDGRWRYYLGNISVFVELIDRVMRDIPRK